MFICNKSDILNSSLYKLLDKIDMYNGQYIKLRKDTNYTILMQYKN
jgi:hypothetical protein